MEASCCVARKMVRSVWSACSSARIEPGRPILKATLVNGKITTSRIGTIGRLAMSAGVRSEYSSIKPRKNFSPGRTRRKQKASAQHGRSPHLRLDSIVEHFRRVCHRKKKIGAPLTPLDLLERV